MIVLMVAKCKALCAVHRHERVDPLRQWMSFRVDSDFSVTEWLVAVTLHAVSARSIKA